MKPIKSLFILAVLVTLSVAGSAAHAQRYYEPGHGGFLHRPGRIVFGFSGGLGFMHAGGDDITCDNCNSVGGEVEGHVGGMLTRQFALMFETQWNFKTIHADGYNGDTVAAQSTAMIAGQFWLLPQLWIKGGFGLAHLSISDDYASSDLDNGWAVMGAVGYEVFAARYFAIDLQGRLITGIYRGNDDNITAGTIGVGVNWY
ncbi:MAG TPA: hypothetical protein VGM88_29535 [Kofleriaceae bacterium]|jgi:hypothetical protein